MNALSSSARVVRKGLTPHGRGLLALAAAMLVSSLAWGQPVLGTPGVTPSPATVLSGGTVAFEVVVENTGDADATNVVIEHTFASPTPLVFNAGESSGSCSVDAPPTTVTCTVGTLGPAGSGAESATLTVAFDVGATADNQSLSVGFDASGDSLGPVTGSASIDILYLAVSKTDGLSTATPGDDTLTYTISLTNNGTTKLLTVAVADALPSDLEPDTTCSEASPCWTCAPTPSSNDSDCGTGSDSNGAKTGFGDIAEAVNIGSGETVKFTIIGDVAASALGVPCPSDGTKDCVFNSVDIEDSLGVATDETELDPRAKLVVTKTGPSPNEAVPGTTLVYTFTIENEGPSDAQAVAFSNVAETALGAVTYGGDCSGTTACDLGTLAAKDTATVTASYAMASDYHIVNGTSDLTHTATVTSDTPEPDSSPSPRTNSGPSTPVVPKTDLTVLKSSATSSPVSPGEAISYTVTVANAGPSDAAGAEVSDQLIPDLVGATWTCTATSAACPAGGVGNVEEAVDIDAGGSVVFTVTGIIDPGITGSSCVDASGSECLANTATVTPPPSPYVDAAGTASVSCLSSDPDDQTCTFEIELAREADLHATKDDGKTVVAPGEAVPYTIVVGNAGPSDVLGASLTDAVTGPFECVGSSCWTCTPAPELSFIGQAELSGGAVGLDSPRGMAVSPDGAHLYVAASAGNTVVVFERDAASTTLPYVPEGGLTYISSAVDSSTGLSGARGVAVSPDGAYVYATGSADDALVVFARNQTMGADYGKLTSHQVVQDDQSPSANIPGALVIDGLAGASGVAVSPDGRYVYATGRDEDAVVVLERQTDGTLALVQVLQDKTEPSSNISGATDVPGLGGALAVAVSPDSRHVYVASFDDGAVVALERASDGTLSSIDSVIDGSDGVDGLAGARSLAISQDGAHLYAVGETDQALVLLRRAADGTLTWVDGGVTSGGGLATPGGVAVSPDGTRVLVSVGSDALLKVWERSTDAGTPADFGTLDPVSWINLTELNGARAVVMDPAGRSAYAAASDDDSVAAFAVTGGAECGAASGSFATLEAGVDLDLPAGSYVTVKMPAAKVPSGTSLGSTLTNTATVAEPASGVTETGPLDNVGTDVDDIRSLANLSITKTGSATAVPGQGGLTYTITVFNAGPQAASGVLVNDAFPFADGIASVSWTCSGGLNGGTCGTASDTGDITDVAVNLPANGGVQFAVTATVAKDAWDSAPACTGDAANHCLANFATVALPPGSSGQISDPDTTNNTSATVETVLTPRSDLVVTKVGELVTTDPGGGAPPERSITYTITVRNCGPSTASDIVLEDEVLDEPTALRLENASWSCLATNGSCGSSTNPDPGHYLQDLELDGGDPALCSGADASRGAAVITFTADLVEGAGGILTNTVQVGSTVAFDPQPSNNAAEHSTVLTAKADLAVMKVGDATATPGEETTYSITVTNSGPQDVVRAKVVDLLPAELENVTWSCSAESPASGLLRLSEVHRDDGLGAASAVAVSPDGEHVYATGAGQDALVVFERRTVAGPDLGKLAFLEVFQDPGSGSPVGDATGVEGLAGASAVAVSPDGLFVYATGPDDASLVVFSRDPNSGSSTFGQLTHLVTISDGGGVTGLAGASGLALSPDGDTIYVTSATPGAVVVVDRDLGTGVHEWAATHVNGGGVSGLGGAAAAAVSPDGAHLYVAGATDNAVAVFSRAADGSLTFKSAVTDGGAAGMLDGASALVLSPDIDGPAGPAVGGQQLYVAAAGAGSVVMFSRETDPAAPGGAFGDLSSPVPLVNGDGTAPNVVDGLTGASGLAVSADGQHLYVSAAGDGVPASAEPGDIAVFRRNTASGTLTWLELQEQGVGDPSVDGLEQASGVAVSPDGRTVYGSGAASNAVAVFDRAGPPPAFRYLETQREGVTPESGAPAPTGLDGVNSVVVSPDDGSHVYVASIGADALAVFSRDTDVTSEGYGTLAFEQVLQDDDATPVAGATVVDGLLGASAIAIDSTQQNLYLASQEESTLVVFDLNPDGSVNPTPRQVFQDPGAPSPVAGAVALDGLNGAVGVAVSPDDQQVWVTGQYDAALVVFNRNPATGALTKVQVRHDADLSGAYGVAGTADNRHVFVVSAFDDSLLVYERNVDGTLTLLQTIVDGSQGSDGLNQAHSVAVSPDDRHVYVTGSLDNAVAVFEREVDVLESDPAFGRLVFQQVVKDGDPYRWDLLGDPVAYVDGLSGARSVKTSADGRYVYVAGEYDDAVAIFARDADADSQNFGTLTFVEARSDGDIATGNRIIDGLAQARSVAVSPDDKHLYVGGHVDDAVASFFRTAVSRCTEAGSGNIADVVDLAFGGTLTYTITGTVNPGASDELVNTATIFDPSGCPRESGLTDGCNDTNLDNNTSAWTTSLRPQTDIGIAKSNGVDTVVPGQDISYTITVTNDGPSNVVGAMVTDVPDAGLFTDVSWTCLATPSGALDFVSATLDGDTLSSGDDLRGLRGASSVAFSPDGLHAYVASAEDHAVAVFAMDPVNGTLTFQQLLQDVVPAGQIAGATVVEGLGGASAVAVDPSGLWVYVAGKVDDTLVILSRDPDATLPGGDPNPDFGSLTLHDSLSGAGFDQPVALASVDNHVYVASANDDALVAVARDGSDVYSVVGVYTDGVVGNGLDGASAVAVSPDGTHVYVTGANDDAVAWFTRNTTSGALTYGNHLVNGDGTEGLTGAGGIAVSPDGLHVYVAGTGEDALVVFGRDWDPDTSTGSGALAFERVYRDGQGGVDGLRGADDVVLDSAGTNVYVAGRGDDAIAVFRRDTNSDPSNPDFGELVLVEVERDSVSGVNGLAGARDLAISADDRWILGAGTGDDGFALFRRPADSSCPAFGDGSPSGALVNLGVGGSVVFTVEATVADDACSAFIDVPCELTISNTATVQDAGCVGSPPSLTGCYDPVLDDNTDTDEDDLVPRANLQITKTDHVISTRGLAGVATVAVAPDGDHVYAASPTDEAVSVFARDGADQGTLDFVAWYRNGEGGVSGLSGASALALSPDGRQVYVAGSSDNAIVVFDRDWMPAAIDASGELTFSQEVVNGFGGVTGLLGVADLAFSPTGAHLYAVGANQDALAVFERNTDASDAAFGTLQLLEVHFDGDGGVTGLRGASSVCVAPDGRHVVATGFTDDAVLVFARDADPGSEGFGTLEPLQVLTDGVDGVDGIAGPTACAISAGGSHVYVLGSDENALAVFARDAAPASETFGELTPLQVLRDGEDDVDGLAGGVDVVVSVDGRSVYVAGATDDAVAVLDRVWNSGDEDFGRLAPRLPLAALKSGVGGAAAVALSHDGTSLYVAAAADDALAVFDRNWDAGGSVLTDDPELVELEIDGGGGLSPGDDISYEIRVLNAGPSAVFGATVTDYFPAELEAMTWSCTPPPGGSCRTELQDGDLIDVVSIPAGEELVYTVNGRIKSGTLAEGIVNTATVEEPTGVIDAVPTDNSATDGDTLLTSQADLEIHKTLLTSDVVAGGEVLYQITVMNTGPSTVRGAMVVDHFPEAIHDVLWTCDAEPDPGKLLFQPDGVDDLDGLGGARSFAEAPDGRHAYAVGFDDNSIVSYRRELRSGRLVWLETLRDGDVQPGDVPANDVTVEGLEGPSAVVVSPDGAYVYVAAALGDTVAVFARDGDGRLHFREVRTDLVNGVSGIGGARALTMSPDGGFLYVAGEADDAVAVFSRNAATGSLTFVQAVLNGTVQGVKTVAGLLGVRSLAISPNGASLYAAGADSSAVAVFARGADGRITYLQNRRDGVDGVDGLAGASGVTVTGDGHWVLATGRGDDAVALFERDTATGGLTFVASVADGDPYAFDGDGLPVAFVDGLGGASALAVSHDDEHVYVSGADDDAVAVFARDAATGVLSFVEAIHNGDPVGDPPVAISGLVGPDAVAVSSDDTTVYVAAETGDAVLVFSRLEGSRCTESGFGDIVDVIELSRGGTATYLASGIVTSSASGELVNLASVTPSATNRDPLMGNNVDDVSVTIGREVDLVVTKTDGIDTATPGTEITYQIVATNRGPSDVSGVTLTDTFPVFAGAPGDTPGGFLSGSMSWDCFRWSQLSFVEAVGDSFGAVGIAGPAGAAMAPDLDGPGGEPGGEHLYVPAFTDNVVRIFARDPAATDGLGDPNPDYGRLTLIGTVAEGMTQGAATIAGLDGPTAAALSPDGKHLYVTGQRSSALALFSRDADPASPDYGLLTWIDTYFESDIDIDGLEGAVDVVVSPDGLNVYVAGREDDAVVVFSRDADPASPTFGRLDWVERKKNGFGAVPFGVLDGASSLAISSDGAHLYVGAGVDDALSVFRRDPSSGMLTLVEVLKDDEAVTEVLDAPVTIVNALDFVVSLALTPAGGQLYAASLSDDAISVFRRETDPMDPDYGRLTLVEVKRDGVGGVDGLDGAIDLAVSPDAAFLYAAAVNDDALSVFGRVVNPTSPDHGKLTLLRTIRDGEVGSPLAGGLTVDGLDAVRGIVLSPDSGHLYSLAELDDAVGMFARTAASSCPGAGSGALAATIDLAAGSSILIQATGTIDPGARGELTNTVTITPPAGVTESEPGDNTATDVDQLVAVTDLALTKTNGVDSVVAGRSTTYTISVTNAGPSHAVGATVSDVVSAKLLDVSWTCVASAGSACTAGPEAGDIDDIVDVLVGGTLTYTLTGTVDPNSRGSVTNVATVVPFVSLDPPSFPSDVDPDYDPPTTYGNNRDDDIDPIVPVADLAVTKDDGVAATAPGEPITYTIVVSNLGPSDALLASVSDVMPAALVDPSWTCVPDAGASCTAGPVTGDIDDTVVLPVGLSVTYTVSATVDVGATGELVNTVVVDPTPEATDPETGNNTASDVDTLEPSADLAITKSATVSAYVAGELLHYDVVVTNLGPSDVLGALVQDTLPSELTGATWICTAAGGAACPAPSGAGDLAATVDLPLGGELTFEIEGVVEATFTGLLVNTATVTEPTGIVDTDQSNNSATATTPNETVLFSDGFETNDTSRWSYWEPALGGKGRVASLGRAACLAVDLVVDAGSTPAGEAVSVLVARDADGSPVVRLRLARFGDVPWIGAAIRQDDDTWLESGWAELTEGRHDVSLQWQAETAPGRLDGGVGLWLDGVRAGGLSGVGTGPRRAESLHAAPAAREPAAALRWRGCHGASDRSVRGGDASRPEQLLRVASAVPDPGAVTSWPWWSEVTTEGVF